MNRGGDRRRRVARTAARMVAWVLAVTGLAVAALAAARPAAAMPTGLLDMLPQPRVVGQQVPSGHPAHRGRPGSGTDEHLDAKASKLARAERNLALAATWHLDPALLKPLPTDRPATTAAREQLAVINGRLTDVVAHYDAAHAAADEAHARARQARADLEAAKAALRAAAARYRADRALLTDVFTESYTTTQIGALGLLLSADSDEDLVQGLTVLQEMGRNQTDAVERAQRSRDRLQAATVAVAAAEQEAQDRLEDARATLAAADAARRAVLADVKAARQILENSVLADQAVRDATANGYDGAIRFPLPPGTSYVDQHNWGHRSKHWASVHTGDDFSTACGTPVLAVTDGTVLVRTDQHWSGPWLVMVSTGEGRLTTWYAHMQALTVGNGEWVRAGEQIGVVGARGNATGCHLHLEVHPTGGSIYADNTDPSAWLQTVGAYPEAN